MGWILGVAIYERLYFYIIAVRQPVILFSFFVDRTGPVHFLDGVGVAASVVKRAFAGSDMRHTDNQSVEFLESFVIVFALSWLKEMIHGFAPSCGDFAAVQVP